MVFANKRIKWLAGLIGTFLVMAAPSAMALTVPGVNFPVPSGDKSLEMIGSFLGGSGGIPGSAAVMEALMLIFNGAILSLASIVAFYTICSAVVQTAHDGEVLGKRYSSLWVPIRAATGIAAIVPAPGFSAVQILVLWVAAQGVGLADSLYNVGIDAVTARGGFVRPVVMQDAGKGIAAGMAKISACVAANQADLDKAKLEGKDQGYTFQIVTSNPNSAAAAGGDMYASVGPEMTVMDAQFVHASAKSVSCGKVIFTVPKAEGEVGAAIAQSVYQSQVDAAKTALDAASIAMQSASAGSTQASAEAAAKAIHAAAAAYNFKVNKAIEKGIEVGARKAATLYAQEISDLKTGGWATAGGSFMSLNKFTSQLSTSAVADSVSVRASAVSVLENDMVLSQITSLTKAVTSKNAAMTGESPEDADDGIVMRKFKEILHSSLFQPIKALTSSMTGGNPLSEMKALGDSLLWAVAGIVAALIVAQTALGNWVSNTLSLGSSGGVSSAIASMMVFFSFVLIGLLTMGITMATYIPLVPYIIWLSVLISWMIAVAEAVIASPLWMMMHINPEGEGFATGATEAGYKFVAAVFLRPGLSVISFFIASSILFAMGGFVNATFFKVVDATQSDSVTGLFSFLGFMFVYTSICITLVQKSFALCLTIPEAILRWIGSSLTGGENMEGGAHSQFTGAASVVSNAGSNSMRPRGPKGGQEGGGKDNPPPDPNKNAGGKGDSVPAAAPASNDPKPPSGDVF
jgi:conjugal transfer/type IV secretion protein DotA/TraY